MARQNGWRFDVLGILLTMAWSATAVAQFDRTRPVDGLRHHLPDTYALVGGRIVVAPGRVIESGTLVVRRGLIESVGPDAAVPEGARQWDVTGKTIYPGLVDAYSETNLEDGGPASAGYWNSHVRPERLVADRIRITDEENERYRRQGIAVRLVAPREGIIKGQSALLTTGGDDAGRAMLRAQAALHLRLTAPRDRSRDEYPSSPMGAVALARQAFYDAIWYRDAWQVFRAQSGAPRPEQNDALQALQPFIDQQQLVIIDTPDEQYLLRADRFAREFGLRIALVGSGHEYRRLKEVVATGRAMIVPVDFPQPPDVSTPEAAADVSLEQLMHWDHAPENPARLAAAGVPLAITSHGLDENTSFLDALRVAVRRGLAPDDALRATTDFPARLLEVDRWVGTLEPGKLAHFFLTDGPLFDDSTKIVETWIDGTRYVIERTPPVDPRGRWDMEVEGRADGAELIISGEPRRLKASWRFDEATDDESDEEVELEAVEFADARFSGRFDADAWQAGLGMALLSATIFQKSDDDQLRMIGRITLPDGSVRQLSGRRVGPPEDEPESTDAEANDAPEADTDEAPSTDDPTDSDDPSSDASPPAETEPSDRPPNEGERRDVPKQPPHEEVMLETRDEPKEDVTQEPAEEGETGEEPKEGDEKQEESDDGDDEKDEPTEPASFPVNYPLGAFGLNEAPEQPEWLVFRQATVWTCGPAGVLERADVLVHRGTIHRMAPTIDDVPEGAVSIDASGRHLSPGIIDCHSHMATDGGINEGTQAITAEVRIGDFIDASDMSIYRQLAGGVTSANILHGSANPIGGQSQVIKLRWGATGEEMKFAEAPAGIKFALGENVKRSNWGGGEASGRYPQSRMGVEQIIRDAFLAARQYRHRQRAWETKREGLPPRFDLELEALAEIQEGTRWIHCHSYRQDEILALLRTLESFGIQIGTLQHVLEGYKVADALRRHGAMASSFSDWWAYKIEVFDAIPFNGALMHQAGVVVSFNSDDQELARHLNHEAAKAVKYGDLPPEEALKFVTLNPARQLRIDQYVGSIEAGKHADLVLWSGPPLAVTSRCEQTWIDGRKYFDLENDRAARDRWQSMRAALVQKILQSGQKMQSEEDDEPRERDLWPRIDIYCHAQGALAP